MTFAASLPPPSRAQCKQAADRLAAQYDTCHEPLGDLDFRQRCQAWLARQRPQSVPAPNAPPELDQTDTDAAYFAATSILLRGPISREDWYETVFGTTRSAPTPQPAALKAAVELLSQAGLLSRYLEASAYHGEIDRGDCDLLCHNAGLLLLVPRFGPLTPHMVFETLSEALLQRAATSTKDLPRQDRYLFSGLWRLLSPLMAPRDFARLAIEHGLAEVVARNVDVFPADARDSVARQLIADNQHIGADGQSRITKYFLRYPAEVRADLLTEVLQATPADESDPIGRGHPLWNIGQLQLPENTVGTVMRRCMNHSAAVFAHMLSELRDEVGQWLGQHEPSGIPSRMYLDLIHACDASPHYTSESPPLAQLASLFARDRHHQAFDLLLQRAPVQTAMALEHFYLFDLKGAVREVLRRLGGVQRMAFARFYLTSFEDLDPGMLRLDAQALRDLRDAAEPDLPYPSVDGYTLDEDEARHEAVFGTMLYHERHILMHHLHQFKLPDYDAAVQQVLGALTGGAREEFVAYCFANFTNQNSVLPDDFEGLSLETIRALLYEIGILPDKPVVEHYPGQNDARKAALRVLVAHRDLFDFDAWDLLRYVTACWPDAAADLMIGEHAKASLDCNQVLDECFFKSGIMGVNRAAQLLARQLAKARGLRADSATQLQTFESIALVAARPEAFVQSDHDEIYNGLLDRIEDVLRDTTRSSKRERDDALEAVAALFKKIGEWKAKPKTLARLHLLFKDSLVSPKVEWLSALRYLGESNRNLLARYFFERGDDAVKTAMLEQMADGGLVLKEQRRIDIGLNLMHGDFSAPVLARCGHLFPKAQHVNLLDLLFKNSDGLRALAKSSTWVAAPHQLPVIELIRADYGVRA